MVLDTAKAILFVFQCIVTQYLFLANVPLIMSDICYSFSVRYLKACSLCFDCC